MHYWKLVLCRGPEALPRAKSRALGKDLLCRGPPTEALGKSPRQRRLCRGPGPRQRKALGKDALGNFSVLSNGSRAPSAFAEGHPSGPRQRFLIFFYKILCRGPRKGPRQRPLCRGPSLALGKDFFFLFLSSIFLGTNHIILNIILKIGTNFNFLYIFFEFISIRRNFHAIVNLNYRCMI